MAQVTSPRHAPGSVWWRALSTDAIEHEGVNMALAQRLSRLGTETTFAVALAAADWKSQGNRVYPFHLGGRNLPTTASSWYPPAPASA